MNVIVSSILATQLTKNKIEITIAVSLAIFFSTLMCMGIIYIKIKDKDKQHKLPPTDDDDCEVGNKMKLILNDTNPAQGETDISYPKRSSLKLIITREQPTCLKEYLEIVYQQICSTKEDEEICGKNIMTVELSIKILENVNKIVKENTLIEITDGNIRMVEHYVIGKLILGVLEKNNMCVNGDNIGKLLIEYKEHSIGCYHALKASVCIASIFGGAQQPQNEVDKKIDKIYNDFDQKYKDGLKQKIKEWLRNFNKVEQEFNKAIAKSQKQDQPSGLRDVSCKEVKPNPDLGGFPTNYRE